MKLVARILLGLLTLFILAGLVYSLPPVRVRLEWRIAEWQARIQYALSPPEEAVFIPSGQGTSAPPLASPTSTLAPAPTGSEPEEAQPAVPPSPTPSAAPTSTAMPLPASAQLTGFRHEYQTWNNCGPATLSMALSFWGWQGDQADAAGFLKPNPRDKNVMPYELAAYIEAETDFNALVRVGGDRDLVQRFIAAGLPVILEKGFEGPAVESWMGHYVLVTGYDDAAGTFTTQDSFLGPDVVISYEAIDSFWRAFNFTYIAVYPAEREFEVAEILGVRMDEAAAIQAALEIASTEIYTLAGRDRFFAWFNRGSSLVALQDYAGAARAYDEAFTRYAELLPEERPWRMMWYQTGPYWAYFYTGRYVDVVDLATTTLDAMSEPVLEESYYWRGLAREALGDLDGAIEDWQNSLIYHPGFGPSAAQLARLGVESP